MNLKELKTSQIIFELLKRFILRVFKIIFDLIKLVFGFYKGTWSRSKAEFGVLAIMTLLIVGSCYWFIDTKQVHLTRGNILPVAQAQEQQPVPIEPQFDKNALAQKIDQYLISKNSPISGQGLVIVDAGLKHRIEPEVIVAIMGADTSFGKNLTTPFNVGNVFNNVAGQRVGFNNWAEGIDAIAWCLNNEYLGHKQTIGELSYGGGGKGWVYATSIYNWNNNVKSFLSEQKGQFLDESYPFRLK